MQKAQEILPGVQEFVADARDLSQELKKTVNDLMFCIRHTRPSKQFLAELILGTISLEMTIKRLDKTGTPKEKEALRNEFKRGTGIIQKGMTALWERAGISPEEVAIRVEALTSAAKLEDSSGSVNISNLPGRAEEV